VSGWCDGPPRAPADRRRWSIGCPGGATVRHAHQPTGGCGPSGVRAVRRSATRTIRPADAARAVSGRCDGPPHAPSDRRGASDAARSASGRSDGPPRAPSDPAVGRLAGRLVSLAHAPTAEGSFAGPFVGPGSQHHRRAPRIGPSRPVIRLPSGGSVRPAHGPTGQLWSGTTPGPTSVPGSSPIDPPPVIPWSRTTASPTSEPARELTGPVVVGDHSAPTAGALVRRPADEAPPWDPARPRRAHPRCASVMVRPSSAIAAVRRCPPGMIRPAPRSGDATAT
jgi:hypothetical protein